MDAAYVTSALRSIALLGPMSMRRAPTRDRIAFGLLSPPRRSSRGRRSSKFSSKPGRGLAWDRNVFRSRLFSRRRLTQSLFRPVRSFASPYLHLGSTYLLLIFLFRASV
jgi:hypothetical protein